MFALVQNGVVTKYPATFYDLQTTYPNTSFVYPPVPAPAFGWFEVVEVTKPTPTSEQVVAEGAPVVAGDTVTQNWVVTDLTAPEIAAKLAATKNDVLRSIRAKRIERERAGATSGARTVRADPETLTRLFALQAAAVPGEQIPVEMVDGTVEMVPGSAITGLVTAVQARMLALANVEATKRVQVDALVTIDAVLAYDVNAGWPA